MVRFWFSTVFDGLVPCAADCGGLRRIETVNLKQTRYPGPNLELILNIKVEKTKKTRSSLCAAYLKKEKEETE